MRYVLVLMMSLGLLACTETTTPETTLPERAGSVAWTGAWARVAPEGGTSAVYVQLANGTAKADTLVGVASTVANVVEIHESYVADEGMRGMRPVPYLPVPSGATVALQPGGYHVMLIQLREPLAQGDTVAVALTFAQAGVLPLRVPVRSAAP